MSKPRCFEFPMRDADKLCEGEMNRRIALMIAVRDDLRARHEARREAPLTTSTTIPAEARFGLSRSEAAEYLGVSPTLFDDLVRGGLMPQAKMMKGRRIWLRPALERAAADLPDAANEGINSPTPKSSPYSSPR